MAISDDIEIETHPHRIEWVSSSPEADEARRAALEAALGSKVAAGLGMAPRLAPEAAQEHEAVLEAQVAKFRCLQDWTVEFANAGFAGFVEVGPDNPEDGKGAVVHPPREDAQAPKHKGLVDYYLHEVLHVALAAARREPEREETLIQDLLELVLDRPSEA